MERSFHSTFLLGKLQQVVRWATNRKGGVSSSKGCLHEDQATCCGCPPGETPQNVCTPCGKTYVRRL